MGPPTWYVLSPLENTLGRHYYWCCSRIPLGQSGYLFWGHLRGSHWPWPVRNQRIVSYLKTISTLMWKGQGRMVLWWGFSIKRDGLLSKTFSEHSLGLHRQHQWNRQLTQMSVEVKHRTAGFQQQAGGVDHIPMTLLQFPRSFHFLHCTESH